MSPAKYLPPVVALLVVTHVSGASAQTAPAAPASAPAAQATDPRHEAKEHFRRGVELVNDDDPKAALIEFERAYAIAPSFQVLFNIGQVRFQLKDYVGALDAFERYLADGGAAVPRERREDVARDMESLRVRIATVEVRTERGAVVYLDGAKVGEAPLPPIRVNAGHRVLRAVIASRPSAEAAIDLAGGDAARVDLAIPAAPATPAGSADASAASPAQRTSPSALPWVFWGLTGALAVGAGVTGGLALSASSDANGIRTNGGRLSDYDNDQHRMRTFAAVTDVLGGAAIASATVATILLLTRGSPPTTGSASPPLRLGIGPGSAAIEGRF